jgi:hypothetical protein
MSYSLGEVTPLELQPGESEAAFLARLRKVKDQAVIGDLQEKYVKQLHAASVAINQARDRNDPIGVRGLLPVFKIYRNRYQAAGASTLELSAFDKFILDTGNWANAAIAALPNAIAALPKAIGWGLLKGAFPFLLAGAAFLVLKKKGYV